MEQKSKLGGYRPNAGRKATGRDVSLNVRISKEAMESLEEHRGIKNKSEFIDELLRGL